MLHTKQNFFETDDGTILYYEDYGQGEPIVLLHGFCCSSQVFKRNIKGLSQNHRLVLMDLRGHGASSKTLSGVTMPRMAQDVKNLIEYLHLEDVTLLGWSMGAQVALMYWRLFGGYGYVRRLGILDATLYPFSDGDWNFHGNRCFKHGQGQRPPDRYDGKSRGRCLRHGRRHGFPARSARRTASGSSRRS